MTRSADSIKRMLTWVDRGMVFYLQWVGADSIYNTLIAKVYHQGGAIHASIKHIPEGLSPELVDKQIEECKQLLAEKVARHVARRLDNALQGEI